MRQLLDGQKYPVIKGDIIKKEFYREATVEQCLPYLHGLSHIPVCPRYMGDRIILCTCLQILPMDNNAMLVAAQFIVDFRGMHLNTNKDLYINFQKHASIFCKAMLSKINGGGNRRW